MNNQLGTFYSAAIVVSYNVNWYIGSTQDVLMRSPGSLSTTAIVKEVCELALIVGLYLNLRPRVWPQFFFSEMREESRENRDTLRLVDLQLFNDLQAGWVDVSVHESNFVESSDCNTNYSLCSDSAPTDDHQN